MIMKKIFFIITLIVCILTSGKLYSQNVIIEGTVNKSNALVRLFTYNDMLTCEQTLIAETKSDGDGNFVIKTDVDGIQMSQIAVDLERVDVLLRPDANYKIKIIIPDQADNISYFERQDPTLRMLEANDDNLYYQYFMTEILVNDFVLENFNHLYRRRQTSLLDSLDVIVEKSIGALQSDYVKDYLRYRKAAIQMAIDNDNAKKVVNQYFDNQDILYSQPSYMDLFNELFVDYLSRQFNPSELLDKLYLGYDNFFRYIKGNDAFLSDNIQLAELITIWNLRRMYYENSDDRQIILKNIRSMIECSENQMNINIAKDILKQIDRLAYNTEAPFFSLKDKDGNLIKLCDYQDNMVLLQFVDKVNPMLNYQFDELDRLQKQWQDTIQIVTIATKDGFDDFVQMFDNKGFNWELLNLGDDILLLEDYQVKTFPEYIIISQNGRIGMAPAPSPEQFLDFHVRRIYKYLKK